MPTPAGRKYGICPVCGTRTMKRYMHQNRTQGYQWKCVNPGHWWRARKLKSASQKKKWRKYRKSK